MRGISSELFEKVDMLEYPDRLEFPMISVYGREVGKIINRPNDSPQYYHVIDESFRNRSYLYNEQVLVSLFYGKPVVVVEGVWDCLSLMAANIPVIAATTNQLRKPHLEKIYRYTNKIILWFDSDKHGETGIKFTQKRLRKMHRMMHRIFPCNAAKDANALLVADQETFSNKIKELKTLYKEFDNV